MLLELAEICSMKGIVPGHIKALIREKDAYALLSCTRAGNVNVKNSPAWREALLEHPELNLNVILADSPLDHVETLVERKLKQTFPGYQLLACAHQHLHDHVCAD
ncbi:hypothetical protein DCMF_08100 [Candidatus Formimonas warabiya]|uniref:Uncharacterized protein n=2 Tax=Formimonas warabiya TaxID=1761012 RepID=A0A3G1KQK6_FORW1|nr:hypothetical protein DCMF_08100 [Candidatus Formimonas warabiya]